MKISKYLHILYIVIFLGNFSVLQAEEFDLQKAERKVFKILCSYSEGTIMGTGFVISKGKISTNYHVVRPDLRSKIFCVRINDGMTEVYEAHIIWSHKKHDLAVLEVKDLVEEPFEIFQGDVKKLQECIALGFPGRLDNGSSRDDFFKQLQINKFKNHPANDLSKDYLTISATTGEVIKITPWMRDTQITNIVHTARVSHGNSGGPLLDQYGRVIAINTQIGVDLEKGTNLVDGYSSHIKHLIRGIEDSGIECSLDISDSVEPQYLAQKVWKILIVIIVFIVVLIICRLYMRSRKIESVDKYIPIEEKESGIKDYKWVLSGNNPEKVELISLNLPKGIFTLGRSIRDNDYQIDNSSVSKSHIRIEVDNEKIFVTDLGSSNGTYIDDYSLVTGAKTDISKIMEMKLGDVSLELSRYTIKN